MKRNKNVLLPVLCILMLLVSGCSPTEKPESEENSETGKLDNGSPWVDYDLSENIALVSERPADAKDDLYLYVNYEWLKSTSIRPGYRSESTFTTISDEIREMSMSVLTDKNLESEDAKMVQNTKQKSIVLIKQIDSSF